MHDFLRLPHDQNNLPATVGAAIAASRLVVKMPPVLVAYWYHTVSVKSSGNVRWGMRNNRYQQEQGHDGRLRVLMNMK